jgi:hypothetical protein
MNPSSSIESNYSLLLLRFVEANLITTMLRRLRQDRNDVTPTAGDGGMVRSDESQFWSDRSRVNSGRWSSIATIRKTVGYILG